MKTTYMFKRAINYCSKGEYDEAIFEFQKILKNEPYTMEEVNKICQLLEQEKENKKKMGVLPEPQPELPF